MASNASCIFCRIIKGEIPAMKLYESSKTLAFLDIQPLSTGHALIIPKHHGAKLHEIPSDALSEILSVVQKVAKASGAVDYNVLQNNGRAAHQMVDHVHFHMIPKVESEGLGVGWEQVSRSKEELGGLAERMRGEIARM